MSKSLWKNPAFEDVFCAFRGAAEAIGPRPAVRLLLENADLHPLELVEVLEDAQAEEVAAAQEGGRARSEERPTAERAAQLAGEAVAILEIGGGSEEPPIDPRALSLLRAGRALLEISQGQEAPAQRLEPHDYNGGSPL